MTAPQLLTIPEVAGRLKCSRNHVYELHATGRLPFVEVSAKGTRPRSRVDQRDLEAFITARRRTP